MLVKELFEQDPTTWRLVNEGVSSNNATDPETLEYELRTFVCDGEYNTGLVKILEGYLDGLGKVQKAAWVSGFYGSGKSHLVKVLRYLWTDYRLPSGDKARALCRVTNDVRDKLKELDGAGKKSGGLHSAGGTLKAGAGSVRLRLLGIVFQSLGLPAKVPIARLKMDLRDDGTLDAVEKAIEKQGKNPEAELERAYTSPAFQAAYLASYPAHANVGGVAKALGQQYPAKTDEISIDDMVLLMRRALSRNGKLPCTLVVLDEVQQFINGDAAIALEVQEVVEGCSNGLEGKVMFVGTGQSALTDTPALQRLMGRFAIKVHLKDNDVDRVIRTVILQKKEGKKKAIEDVISKHLGEVTRQLKGTKIATRSDDDRVYVADYPLLPVRRRFWEKVLHACDPSGTAAQMRTQLRVTHEACRSVAKQELGAVIPGDFLYSQLASALVMSGELQKRFQEIIDEQEDKQDGHLRSRICGLVFLINKLPRDGADTHVRATAEHIADLLTDDLGPSATEMREEVPKLLQKLREEAVLMWVDDEYRLQTTEGAAWESEYRSKRTALLNNEASIAAARGQELSKALQKALGSVSIAHGAAKVGRKVLVHHGSESPSEAEDLTLWVRDGFQEAEASIIQDIQRRSVDDPTMHIVIPRNKKDELKSALASAAAAEETINYFGNPSGREAEEARSSMVSRQASELQKVSNLVREVIGASRVFLSGGQEITGSDLKGTVQTAAEQVLQRLYPKFDAADSPNWGSVWKKAKDGNSGALSQVGYSGDPNKHPVAAELLTFIGAGKKGADVEGKYSAPPYGWPKDAVDATLAVLMVSGHLDARLQGATVRISDLDQRKIAQAEFRLQHPVLTASQKLKVKKLFTDAGFQFAAGEEAEAAPAFVRFLKELASKAGSIAPAPEPPKPPVIQELETYQGNDLLFALFNKEAELHEKVAGWKLTAAQILARWPNFELAERLVRHGTGIAGFDEFAATLETIRSNRSLLDDPDPVSPLLAKVSQAVRKALVAAHTRYVEVLVREKHRIEEHPAWMALPEAKRDALLVAADIGSRPLPPMESDAELAHSLDATPLSSWRTQTDALSARFSQVLHAAIQAAEPKARSVALPAATIKTAADLESWLDQAKKLVGEALKEGPVILP